MPEPLRDKSRRNWKSDDSTTENIQLGCLLRIADATELMAKRHTDLIKELEWMSEVCQERGERIRQLERSLSEHKGQITRLKKQLAESAQEEV